MYHSIDEMGVVLNGCGHNMSSSAPLLIVHIIFLHTYRVQLLHRPFQFGCSVSSPEYHTCL